MDELTRIFGQVQHLLQAVQVPQFLEEWKAIQTMQDSPQFSVAVVGEFSRGKSTLLNSLLGQEILPVGDLPTTALVTHVCYGPELSITRIFPDGRCEKIALEDLKKLSAEQSCHDPQGSLRIEIPSEWLQTNKVEFLDTPGAGDLEQSRSEITPQAIMECDATLVAISATMPLSLTEKSFVEEHIFQRKIPRVACVLTRLDQIKESERPSLIKFIWQKMQAWNSQVALWCSHGSPILNSSPVITVAGPEQILQALAKWTMDKNHKELRTQQMLEQTQFLLKKVSFHLLNKKAALMAEKDSNEINEQREAKKQVARLESDWKDVILTMEQRELDAENWLQQELQSMAEDLILELNTSLDKATQAENWAQRDFPRLVKKFVEQMIAKAEKHLSHTIQEDIQWLKQEMAARFSTKLAAERYLGILQAENPRVAPISLEQAGGLNMEQIGLGVATGIATGFAFPILGPVLFPTTIVGGAIAAYKFMQQEKDQKQKIAFGFRKIVEDMIAKMLEKSKARLRDYYQRNVEKITKSATEYLEITQAVIHAKYAYNEHDLALTQEQERTAKNLIKAIQSRQKGL